MIWHSVARLPLDIFSIPRVTIPASGTIRRCKHSVYWPLGDKIAWCCGLCNPTAARPKGAPLNVVLPKHFADDADMLRANKTEGGRCPECHSRIHFDGGDNWVCADCGHVYSAPRKKTAETELVEVAA